MSHIMKTNSEEEIIMAKVGINGFGRIGRLFFRAALERNDMDNAVLDFASF